MGMFVNLGRTLSLLRDLRGKSQAQVAREAGIGKSQLSKYENGKELPKLDSLEKVLSVLQVGQFEFFYTLHLVDGRAAALARTRNGAEDLSLWDHPDDPLDPLYFPPLLKGHALLAENTDQAFTRVMADLLVLYRRVFEQVVRSGMNRPEDLKAPGA
jgi:transcriptional regulator with XRE-family HTH domain